MAFLHNQHQDCGISLLMVAEQGEGNQEHVTLAGKFHQQLWECCHFLCIPIGEPANIPLERTDEQIAGIMIFQSKMSTVTLMLVQRISSILRCNIHRIGDQ